MKKNIVYLVLLLTFLSCTKEQGVPGPAGPQGPAGANGKGSAADTASIVGKLFLYDEFSNLQNDASGVVVTLTSGSQQQNGTTDTTGRYNFPGITTGTYNLTFQKPAYGTMKLFGLSHFGGGPLPTLVKYIYMMQIPVKTAPKTFTLVANNPSSAVFDLRLDTSSLQYLEINLDLLVYISKNKTVGPLDYIVTLNPNYGTDGSGGYTVNFYKMGIAAPFPPSAITTGDTLYAVAYSYNRYVHIPGSQGWGEYGLGSYYIDPQTGKFVYPNLSKPSNIIKFVF